MLLNVPIRHLHPFRKSQSLPSVRNAGKGHVNLNLQRRSRIIGTHKFRLSTLHDHPPILSQPSKCLTATRKTRTQGAASALLCDCDDFEASACSLHLVTRYRFPISYPQSCTYVISIPLLATFQSHIEYSYCSRQPECHAFFSSQRLPIIAVSLQTHLLLTSYDARYLVLWIHGGLKLF